MPEPERHDLGTPFLRLEREGHLAWCTIERPDSRNALSAAMYFGVKRAVQLVNAMAETAPEARVHVKRILHERYGNVDRMTMDWSLFRGAEAREGMRAFAEKRSPSWIPEALRTGKRP